MKMQEPMHQSKHGAPNPFPSFSLMSMAQLIFVFVRICLISIQSIIVTDIISELINRVFQRCIASFLLHAVHILDQSMGKSHCVRQIRAKARSGSIKHLSETADSGDPLLDIRLVIENQNIFYEECMKKHRQAYEERQLIIDCAM